MIPVGKRDPSVSGAAAGGGDARDDLKCDPVRRQSVDFLAAPAEQERISAFEPDDSFSLAAQPHEQRTDFGLIERVMVALFPDEDSFRIFAAQVDDLRRHQPIVNDDIGLLH